jgi:uncharacterized protein with von Willebrand factor type A (vWA) domain
VLIDFFLHLKSAKLPVSTREFPDAARCAEARRRIDQHRRLLFSGATCLVKDEALYDRFNLAFGSYFKGVAGLLDVYAEIPEEWIAS